MRSVAFFESTLIVNAAEVSLGVIRRRRMNVDRRRWFKGEATQPGILVHIVGLEQSRAIKQPRLDNLCGRERILTTQRARASRVTRRVDVLVLGSLEIRLNVLHEKHAYVIVSAEFIVNILILQQIGHKLEE